MNIEEALTLELNTNPMLADVTGRWYPNVIPQDVMLPAGAYQLISEPEEIYHSGRVAQYAGRFQLTIVADTYAQAKELQRALAEVFRGKRILGGRVIDSCHVVNKQDGYNQAQGKQSMRLDVIIRYRD